MKKYISFIVIFFLIYSIKAQDLEMKFGIKSGVNLSRYTPEKLVDFKSKLGFYIGGYINFSISDKLKIQPELLFYTQGSKILIEDIILTNSSGSNIELVDVETKINESTISLPIILQYSIGEDFSIDGGVQLGYIINRKEKIIENPISGSNGEVESLDYDKFDFGLNIGFGYSLSENIRINTRYFLGVIERNNAIKSSVFSLGLEYQL